SPRFLASIDSLLAFELFDHRVERVKARRPQLVVLLDPCRFFLETAYAERAGAHAPHLPRGDEPRLFQHADMLLHAGERHAEPRGKLRDGRIRAPELLENAAARDVR